ncbi:hypothetical protein CDAR_318381 [Caerostris darwini]|uniref:Uncharacterized protein n=1 Tax=Caerostris darwini TaxID=1538125 RepID=A0AAV4PXP9_9ARAC|nr:hypothetical protein CDAR_318381 [Caerostris darwini]
MKKTLNRSPSDNRFRRKNYSSREFRFSARGKRNFLSGKERSLRGRKGIAVLKLFCLFVERILKWKGHYAGKFSSLGWKACDMPSEGFFDQPNRIHLKAEKCSVSHFIFLKKGKKIFRRRYLSCFTIVIWIGISGFVIEPGMTASNTELFGTTTTNFS